MANKIDIPDGWEKTEFGNIVILRNKKYTPKGSENLKCIELECIEKENGNLLYYLNSNTQKSTKTYFYKNDILYGKLRPYLKKFIYAKDDGVCSSEIWVFSATKKINNYFLFLIVQTNKFNYITNISTGTRMPRADWDIVSNYPILLPPIAEQEKIAEILSLWDKAIKQTRQLIAYKEKQKKGLIQNLLTGKKRLPGFTDEWKTYKFTDLCNVYTYDKNLQINSNMYLIDGLIPIIDQSNSYIAGYTNNIKHLIKTRNDGYIIFGDHTRVIKYINFDFAIGADGTKILYSSSNILNKLLYYYLKNTKISNLGYSRHYKLLKELSFNIPTPLDEQKAIADILCKADEEIELLKKQLDLYAEQKKGLMQNLLTGKVRVTV